ncbi:ankyrin repeat-containing protein [Tanacetum coccineum]
MTNKKAVELDAEFIEYKAEAKASMDASEKKIDDGIGKLDASIKAMKEEYDAKFEELKQLILGTSTHVDHVPQTTKVAAKTAPYVPPIRQGSNKLDPRKTNDMIRERFKPSTDSGAVFVKGMQPTECQGAGTNQAGDRFAYHGFEHRMRKLKMPVFEGEDAYGWIYRVERYFEIQGLPQHEQLRETTLCMDGEALSWNRWSEGQTPFHSWDGFKRRLLIRFQQSQEGNLYEQFLATTQEESARAYVALFEKLAC